MHSIVCAYFNFCWQRNIFAVQPGLFYWIKTGWEGSPKGSQSQQAKPGPQRVPTGKGLPAGKTWIPKGSNRQSRVHTGKTARGSQQAKLFSKEWNLWTLLVHDLLTDQMTVLTCKEPVSTDDTQNSTQHPKHDTKHVTFSPLMTELNKYQHSIAYIPYTNMI